MIQWSERGHVLATRDAEVVYCRVVGVGNMNNCAPFQDYANDMIRRGYHHYVLDFSACDSLDSTFLGILVGLAVGSSRKAQEPTEVVVINASDGIRKTLREIGIDRLLTICRDNVRFPEIPLDRLKSSAPQCESARARMILRAHERLCEVEPANQSQFGAFITLLRRELAAATEDSKGTRPVRLGKSAGR